MTTTMLLLTAGIEGGIFAWVAYEVVRGWIRSGRYMVLHASAALRRAST